MSLRSFADAAGNEWQVFDVIPRPDERRHYDRRNLGDEPSDAGDRRDVDRRLTVGRVPAVTGAEGWLCFERGGVSERRRLQPIPADWQQCDEAQLAAYCEIARPVRRHSLSLQEIEDRDADGASRLPTTD